MFEQFIQIDYSVFDFINQSCSNAFFDWIMPIVRNKKTWIPFYLVAAILLIKFERKKAIWIIALALLTVGLADLISSHFLKDFFSRTRPCLLPTFSDHINLVVERCSGAYSFPSSHAANHFSIAIFFLLLYRNIKPLGLALVLWAGLISFAQIYVGVHFPSDILAGIFVGIMSGAIGYSVLNIILKKIV